MITAANLDQLGRFKKALALDPNDHVTRLVFADFLEENDMPDNAALQRRLAAVYAWLPTREPYKVIPRQYRYWDDHSQRRVTANVDRPVWWQWEENPLSSYLIPPRHDVPGKVFDAGGHSTAINGCRIKRLRDRDRVIAWLEASAVEAAEQGWQPEDL